MNSVDMFVRSIIVITFIWCIAECIMPENYAKKNSPFIYGIIIISMTVSLFTKIDFESFFKIAEIENSGEYNNSYLKNLYEEKLEDALIKKYNNHSIEVELTDEYKLKRIYCNDKKIYEDIMRNINETKN